MPTLWERYQSRFIRLGSNECWPWQARSRDKDDYGILSWRDGGHHFTVRAHRWAFQALHGPLPPGHVVRHTCDNPPCQNPAHWLAGTVADNNADAKIRGRARPRSGGENHHRAVLTNAQVAEARARYTGAIGEKAALAREYGVSPQSMGRILRGTRR